MLGRAEGIAMASIKRMQDLLKLVGNWEGFDVASVSTEDALRAERQVSAIHSVKQTGLIGRDRL